MSTSTLMLQRGSRPVTPEELASVPAPSPTSTWFPISHSQVMKTVTDTLNQAGFEVTKTRLALSRGNARFFAALDLQTHILSGISLAVGIRNSTDKSLPVGFCAGHRTLVCDNLSFSSEVIVARKHTRFGQTRFSEEICKAVGSLHQYREAERERIRRFQYTDLSSERADALLLRAYEKEIVSAPLLPRVLREWRQPSFEEFEPRTVWSLLNAFTTILGERQKSNPQQFAALTIRLNDFLQQETRATETVSTTAA